MPSTRLTFSDVTMTEIRGGERRREGETERGGGGGEEKLVEVLGTASFTTPARELNNCAEIVSIHQTLNSALPFEFSGAAGWPAAGT